MMMRSLFVFLAVLALASAFAPAPFAVLKTTTTTTTGGRLAMFNAGEEGKTLEIAKGGEPASVAPSSSTTATTGEPKMLVKNLGFGKGGEVREVNFVDPAMMANTNPLLMNWWAYILFGFPFVLLSNDFLHFLPTEGPLAFLSKY